MADPKWERPAVPRDREPSEVVLPGKLNTSDHIESDQLVKNVDDWRLRIQRAADDFMTCRHPARRPRGRR